MKIKPIRLIQALPKKFEIKLAFNEVDLKNFIINLYVF